MFSFRFLVVTVVTLVSLQFDNMLFRQLGRACLHGELYPSIGYIIRIIHLCKMPELLVVMVNMNGLLVVGNDTNLG